MKTSNPRDALKRSEKQAAEQQPENFKDDSTEKKTVKIGPDRTNAPIHGIDPTQHKSAEHLRGDDDGTKASHEER